MLCRATYRGFESLPLRHFCQFKILAARTGARSCIFWAYLLLWGTVTRFLLVGSTQPHSGKSSLVLALGLQLKARGIAVGYYKPLGSPTCDNNGYCVDEDSRYIGERLGLQVPAPLVLFDPQALEYYLLKKDPIPYSERLRQQLGRLQQTAGGPVTWTLVEGGASPSEGRLFGLSLDNLVQELAADLLMVVRYQSLASVEPLLSLLAQFPQQRIGVILNDVPASQYEHLTQEIIPSLEAHGIHVLAVLPSDSLMHSISVGELAQKLGAEVLCGRDHLDLLVEQVNIGAMAVSAALRFFRRMSHKAVVTGGDRADIQLAALQTSTNCLILTGQLPPDPKILARAEEMEVPVLSVSHDTLKTVRLIETAIHQARFQEPIKVERMQELLTQYLDLDRFCAFYQVPDPKVSV